MTPTGDEADDQKAHELVDCVGKCVWNNDSSCQRACFHCDTETFRQIVIVCVL